MPVKKPSTIAEYIRSAPAAGQPHLRRLHKLLKSVAPDAEEAIKWGTPFFVEPRFLFAFSAHKSHVSFAPPQAVLDRFRKDFEPHQITKGLVKFAYDSPLPDDLIRRMAEDSLRTVSERKTDSFW